MNIGLGGLLNGFSFGVGLELMRRVIVPAILAAMPLALWWWFGPEKPMCDAVRSQAATVAVMQVVDRIHDVRGDARRAAVIHFTNDSTDFLTKTLRRRLTDTGVLDLEGAPFGEKVRGLLNLRTAGSFDVRAALEYGRKNGLDAVIVGAVDVFETTKGRAVLSGQVRFVRVRTGETVDIPLTDQRIEGVLPPTLVETLSWPLRLLLMTGLLFGLPLLAFPFLRLVMRHDSNLATGGALVLLLAADGVVISLALGASEGFCRLAISLIVLAAACGYDLFMLSYAQMCCPGATGR